jgi:hypothetical protein
MNKSIIDRLSQEDKDRILLELVEAFQLIKSEKYRFCECVHWFADGIRDIFLNRKKLTYEDLEGQLIENLLSDIKKNNQ